ncbi:MAG TPA: branched-chain amino acid ABC transporter permease [Mycobacteriales bacterium]|nr:branched-chain amino acid ABC transporter permease [Mycobacteriales bacterium]
MDPGIALQAVVSGLAQGAVYGLVGLGFTLVHRLTRVLSFAHGDLVVGAVFVGLLLTVGTTPVVATPSVPTAVAQVVLALGAGAVLSVALYLVAVRPVLRRDGVGSDGGAGVLGWVGGTLAAGLLLRESLGTVLTREAYAVADPLRLDRLDGGDGVLRLPGGGSVPVRLLGVLVIGLAIGMAVERLVVSSRTGTAIRAVADDRETAELMGIPTERVVLLAFAVAGLLAGAAGVLTAPGGRLTLAGGVVLGLKGTAAALLGRLGSMRGAVVGGLVLGVVEALAVASDVFGPAYADVLALAVLVGVLALRPEGLRAPPAVSAT